MNRIEFKNLEPIYRKWKYNKETKSLFDIKEDEYLSHFICDEVIIDDLISMTLMNKEKIYVSFINHLEKVLRKDSKIIFNERDNIISGINILKLNSVTFNKNGSCSTHIPKFLNTLLKKDYDLNCCRFRIAITSDRFENDNKIEHIFLENKKSFYNAENKIREEVYDGTNSFIINYLGNNTEIKKLNYLYDCKLKGF